MLQSVAKNILRHHKMTALNAGVGGIFAMGTYDEARQRLLEAGSVDKVIS